MTFKSIFSRFSDPLEMRLKEYDKATYTLHSVFACNDERPRHIKRCPITYDAAIFFRKLVVKRKSLNIEGGKVEVKSLKTALCT